MKSFFKTALIGGITVLLPIALLVFVFSWLFNLVTGLIQPLTDLIVAKSDMRELIADVLVMLIIFGTCFAVGLIIRTRVGRFIHTTLEERLLKIAPGYNLIKETILQLIGRDKKPFDGVALVRLFNSETLMTAFITDDHEDGSKTVFVPTGPNPTSGLIYHLSSDQVHIVDVPVEDAMRSIISCGAGSSQLILAYRQKLTDHEK